jgi:hypothetical protein
MTEDLVTGVMRQLLSEGGESNSQWHPISTAPKDGTHILLYWHSVSRRPVVGWWSHTWGRWQAGNYFCGLVMGDPSHWMPLPAPPTSRPSAPGEAT